MEDVLQQIGTWMKGILVNGIMIQLSGLFDSVNTQVGDIATQVGTTPANFSPGIFSLIRNISESVILPIAGLILTFIACCELIQMIIDHNNLANFETWIFFKWIFKTFVAVTLISNTFNIVMAVFDVAQHMVNKAAGVINTSAVISGDQIVTMVEGLKDKGLGELVMILFETSLIKVAIQVISIVIMLVVYGRMFEIYVYSSVSAIPFATMGNKEWGQIGTNYIKGLFAIGLQGLFLMVCLGIYAVLVKTIKITDIHTSTMTILGYAVLLGLMMLKSGTLAKSVLNAH